MSHRQIAAPWGPDRWAEEWERIVAAEAWCLRWCDYADACPVVGNPHCGPDCQLEQDEIDSRR